MKLVYHTVENMGEKGENTTGEQISQNCSLMDSHVMVIKTYLNHHEIKHTDISIIN